MELLLSFLSILFTFLLFLYMVMKTVKRAKARDRTFHLPPGPWKLPLIGNLHQLLLGGSLPHQKLRDLAKKYGPCMHLQLGEVSTVVVSSPDFAKEIMKTHDVIFASRPRILLSEIMAHNSTGAAFTPYGDYWRQVRKICTLELLSTKRVMSFRSIREEEVSNLVSWLVSKTGSRINLTKRVHSLIYGITSRAAFGMKFEDQELFISAIDEATKVAAGLNIADLYPSIESLQSLTGIRRQIEKFHRVTDRIMESIIAEHKKDKESLIIGKHEEAEDLVDVLLRVQEKGELEFPLTTDNIKAIIFDIFAAGGEPAATTIDWALSELLKNPRLLEKSQAEVREVCNRKNKVDEASIDEMKFLKLVIKETLRLHPPVPLLLPRESRETCVIHGFEIPMKTRIIISAWAIGRDPMYWKEPEMFNPERFLDRSVDYKGTDFEFVPFGAGRRSCPGMSFGVMNVELALAMLLYHFDWKLPNGMKNEDLDMTEAFGITVRRKDDLELIAIPYHPFTSAQA